MISVVVGAQWGDEGKGKIVDYFAAVVARFQGGNNAGHTLVVQGVKTVLHHRPSGILTPKTRCIIGAGVGIDPLTLSDEIDALKARGLLKGTLIIDEGSALVLPYHRALDLAREKNHTWPRSERRGGLEEISICTHYENASIFPKGCQVTQECYPSLQNL